jgi:hypothetical protein
MALYIDGVSKGVWTWANGDGLATYTYITLILTYSQHDIAAGQHAVRVVLDPNHKINLANRASGDCSANWTWSSIVFAPQSAATVYGGTFTRAVVPVIEGRRAKLNEVPTGRQFAAAAATTFVVPTSAHSTGAKGTNWRTDLEVHNPGTTQASFTISLLKRDTDNSNPMKVSLSLAPGLAQRYTDIVDSVFHFSGAAALQVSVTSGTLLVTADTYNRLGVGNPGNFPDGSTYGQYAPALTSDQAITSGDQGRIIQISHDPSLVSNFRTNLGVINATSSQIAVTIDLYTSLGAWLGPTIGVTLRPLEYQQLDKVFEKVTGQVVSDGYAIVRTTTAGGSFYAYASVIDNRTGDPFLIPIAKLPAGANPPTPTPTRTSPGPTPTRTPIGPTPTPTPTGQVPTPLPVVAPSSITNAVLSTMGLIGTKSPSLDSLVSTALTTGVPALVNMAVNYSPSVRSALPNGVRWNFGSGTTNPHGTYTGTIDVTYSNVQINGNAISGQYNVQTTNFTKNGAVRPYDHVSGSVNAQQSSNGKTTGTVTLNGGGTVTYSNGSTVTSAAIPLTGSVQFDTSRCAKYPIGGTITTDYSTLFEQPANTVAGSTTFNGACDGTYQYTGPVEVLASPQETGGGSSCEAPWWWGEFATVTWTGTTFQGSVNRTTTDKYGVVEVDQTTLQGSVSADGKTVFSLHADSYVKSTYPAGYGSCPAGGCTSERWVSVTIGNLGFLEKLAFFDVYSRQGAATFTLWSDHVVASGFPDPSDNYDCTYAIDQSKPDSGGGDVILARP